MLRKLKGKKRIKKLVMEPEKLEERFDAFLDRFDSLLEEFSIDYEVMCGNTQGFTPSLKQIVKAETTLKELQVLRDRTEILAEEMKPPVRNGNGNEPREK